MKNFNRHVALAVALAMLASGARAGSLDCNGATVAALAFHQPGMLYVRMSNMNTPVGICSMVGDWNVPGSLAGTTSATQCKTIYAALLVAKQTGQVVPTMLFDGDSVPTSCMSFAPWTQVNLRWIVT